MAQNNKHVTEERLGPTYLYGICYIDMLDIHNILKILQTHITINCQYSATYPCKIFLLDYYTDVTKRRTENAH
jgi:hypothetical protein